MRSRLGIAVLIAVGCAACGPRERRAPGARPVELRPAVETSDLEPRKIARIDVPAAPSARGPGARARREGEDAGGARAPDGAASGDGSADGFRAELKLPPLAGTSILRARGPFDLTEFDRVVVLGTLSRTCDVQVTFHRKGSQPYVLPKARAREVEGVQALVFDLPLARPADPVYGSLAVRKACPPGRDELQRVELWRRPLASSLPLPGDPLVRAFIGRDGRRVHGLSSRIPLVADLAVARGQELRFSVGQRASDCRPGEESTLVLRAEAPDGRAVEHRETLAPHARGGAPWRSVRVDLGPLAGATAELTLELRGSGDGEVLAALTPPCLVAPEPAPRTVLLVTSDTHRGDHLGVVEGSAVATPALDALAGQGVLFERCWSSTNITVPSHATLMTALSPRDHRVLDNLSLLSDRATTLAEVFRAQGFRTFAVVSASTLATGGVNLDQGFERLVGPSAGVWDAEEAVDALEDMLPDAEGAPLFAWLHLFDAHFPYEPPGVFDRMYYPEGQDPFDSSRPEPAAAYLEALPKELEGLRDVEFPVAQYRAEVSYLDRELGRLLELPRFRAGVRAVTSDHGEILASRRGLMFTHAELYPDTLHVPLILAWPGAPAGTRVERPVDQLGLARTLLDLAGLEDVAFPGDSLVEQLDGPSELPMYAVSAHGFSASVTLGPWHYVLHLRERASGRGPELHTAQLFHVPDDPDCLQDVVGEHPEAARKLRALLVQWLQEATAEGFEAARAYTEAERSELAALGYLTDVPPAQQSEWFDPDCPCPRCARARQ